MDFYFMKNPNAGWDQAFKAFSQVEAAKSSNAESIEIDPDGNIRITRGKTTTGTPTGIEKSTKAEIEKDLVNLTDQLFGIKQIANANIKELFTYKGKIKNFSLKQLDKLKTEDLNTEDKAFVQRMWQFKSNIGLFFDKYRKQITGAQAALAELDRLQERVFSEKMSKAEFEGAVDMLQTRVLRQIRLKRFLLSKDITDKDFIQEFDKLVTATDDPTLDSKERTRRGDELKELFMKSKKSLGKEFTTEEMEDFLVSQLKQEGYIK